MAEKLRIVLIAPEIPDYSIEFCEIAAMSCEVLLCIPDKYVNDDRIRRKPGLEVRRLEWPRQRTFANINFMMRFSKLIRDWKPDLVHFLNESNLWLNLLVPMLGRVPVLTTVHDVQLHPGDVSSRRVPRFFAKTLIGQSDAIVVHGDSLRAEATQAFRVKPECVFVFPHPPLIRYRDIARRGRYSKRADGVFRVLYFGRIYEYKGLKYALEALPLVQAEIPNVRFTIAGTGDNTVLDGCKIDRCGLIEVFNRFISDEDAARLFAEADLLILPYIEASQSGVLMIAVGFGLPVVVTSVGEMNNFVLSTGTGLVVPPRDVPALASAICKMAQDSIFRNRVSQRALAAVIGEYSRKVLSFRILSIYEKVIDLCGRR